MESRLTIKYDMGYPRPITTDTHIDSYQPLHKIKSV